MPVPRDAGPSGESPALQEWAELLGARTRDEGGSLAGGRGLLTEMIRQVLQTGLEVEMTDHLGYERLEALPHRRSGMAS